MKKREKEFTSYWVAVLLFTITISLYIYTLTPTISTGDSPELTASAFTLGVAHPPGYPLFSLLGKEISLIPLGSSVAYRINIFSAICGAITVLLIYLSSIEVRGLLAQQSDSPVNSFTSLAAFTGSLTFAFSPIFWSQSVVSEVYTLNTAFFTGLLYLSLKWTVEVQWSSEPRTGSNTTKASRYLYIISFLWGLGLGNHHTLIAFVPVFALFAIIHLKSQATITRTKESGTDSLRFIQLIPLIARQLSFTALFFILGLSVYLYLPVRSAQNPFIDWGNTENLSGFADVFLRKQFGIGSRNYAIERALSQTGYYLVLLREQFTIAGLVAGITGFLFISRRRPVLSLFTLALFLIHGITTILVLNPVPEDLYSMDVMIIPSLIIFSIWITIGLIFIYSSITTLFIKGLTRGTEKIIFLLLAPISLLLPLTTIYTNFDENNQRNNSFSHDYANDVFDSLKSNAVIFVEADISLFPLWYMQYVEGKRQDVAVLDVDMLMLPWFKKQLKEKYPAIDIKIPDVIKHAKGKGFKPLSLEALESYKVSQVEGMVDNLMERYPVYLSYDFGIPFKEFGERKELKVSQEGIVFRIEKERAGENIRGNYHALRSILKPIESRDEEVLFIARGYIPAMERALSIELSSGREENAVKLLEGILVVDPYHAASLNNLAYLYAEKGKNLNKAERMVKIALSQNPKETARYLKTLGYIYLKKGNYQMARTIFEKVLDMEPGSVWTRQQLKETLNSAGNKADFP